LTKGWIRTIALGLAIAAVVYLSLLSLYVESIPGTGVRVIKGFTCTPDARLVYGNGCPNLGRDALRDAEWEAATLWTGTSVMIVRLSLVVSWLAMAGALALAAARVERRRLAALGRRNSA
jgi:hypothetical protein